MSIRPIYLDRDDQITHLVLNRPQARNAITQAMWQAIPALIAEADADPKTGAIIVRGVDTSAFAAGADIAEFEDVYSTPERARAAAMSIALALDAVACSSKPTIAMIFGACVGGGCSLALACDLRFAESNARFALTPAKLGLSYSIADTRRLAAAVGVARAKDLLFSGRTVRADEALAIGLADRMVAPEALRDETRAYAMAMLANSGAALAATKRIVGRLEAGAADDDEAAARYFLDLFQGRDFAEGYRAFLEKRKPVFRRD